MPVQAPIDGKVVVVDPAMDGRMARIVILADSLFVDGNPVWCELNELGAIFVDTTMHVARGDVVAHSGGRINAPGSSHFTSGPAINIFFYTTEDMGLGKKVKLYCLDPRDWFAETRPMFAEFDQIISSAIPDSNRVLAQAFTQAAVMDTAQGTFAVRPDSPMFLYVRLNAGDQVFVDSDETTYTVANVFDKHHTLQTLNGKVFGVDGCVGPGGPHEKYQEYVSLPVDDAPPGVMVAALIDAPRTRAWYRHPEEAEFVWVKNTRHGEPLTSVGTATSENALLIIMTNWHMPWTEELRNIRGPHQYLYGGSRPVSVSIVDATGNPVPIATRI